MQRTGGVLLSLAPESETRFFVKDSPLRFAFLRDAAGHVSGFDVTTPDGTIEHRTRTDEPLPPERKLVAVDAKVLERYVGQYEIGPGFVLTVTREGSHLFAEATGQPRFEIFPTAATEFFLKAVDAQLTFHTEKGERADSVVLHQGGRDTPARRIH